MATSNIGNWYELNKYGDGITKSNVCANWTGATGTLDGTLQTELLISNFASLTTVDDIIQIADTKIIDSASGQHNVVIDAVHKAVRLNYTKNNITAGSIKGSVLLKGE